MKLASEGKDSPKACNVALQKSENIQVPMPNACLFRPEFHERVSNELVIKSTINDHPESAYAYMSLLCCTFRLASCHSCVRLPASEFLQNRMLSHRSYRASGGPDLTPEKGKQT